MKAVVPEIAWHNKSPVFSVDIQSGQKIFNKKFYRAATGGGDFHIVIWHLYVKEIEGEIQVTADFAADLDRHIKAVNVVRFSPDGKFLASGDDDGMIILWTLKEDQNLNNSITNCEGNKENWVSIKVLRGHKDDIYDLCWSLSSFELFSGSVDNTAIIWDAEKGQSNGIVGEHNGFVQGVAWDPKGKNLATLSSDRALRIFDSDTKKLIAKITKAKFSKIIDQEEPENDENVMRLFHDDTVKTFFRRLCFSPDGNLIFAPCGIFQENENDAKPINATYIFLKQKPNRPILHLPSPDEYTVAVRCCPILFELNPIDFNVFSLPYRIVFAIASRKSVVFYDTQQTLPFAFVSDIHYATLTDISWSPDGKLLIATSSDGYCTFIAFQEGELGTPYSGGKQSSDEMAISDVLEDLGVKPLEHSSLQESCNDIMENNEERRFKPKVIEISKIRKNHMVIESTEVKNVLVSCQNNTSESRDKDSTINVVETDSIDNKTNITKNNIIDNNNGSAMDVVENYNIDSKANITKENTIENSNSENITEIQFMNNKMEKS